MNSQDESCYQLKTSCRCPKNGAQKESVQETEFHSEMIETASAIFLAN
jgi:hypothetical protein